MKCRTIASCAAYLLFINVLPASEPPASHPSTVPPATEPAATQAASLESQLEQLVDQLGDADPAARDDAQEQILDIGEPARPILAQAIKDSQSPQVRALAAYTLKRIGHSLRPTRVTLHLHDAPASEVIGALERQAHLSAVTLPPAAEARLSRVRMSIDVDRVPYWLAVRKICDTVNMRPGSSWRARDALYLEEGRGAWSPQFTSIDGVFAVHASRIRSNFRQTIGERAAQRSSVLELEAFAERRAHALWCNQVRVTQCTDEQGRALNARMQFAYGGMSIGGCQQMSLSLDPLTGEKLSLVEGEAEFMVAADICAVDIPDLAAAKDIERKAGDWKLYVRDLHESAASQWKLSLEVVPPKADDLVLSDLFKQMERTPPDITDEQGRALLVFGNTRIRPSKQGLIVELPLLRGHDLGHGPSGAPAKLHWDMATRVEKATMHFRFTDLPLP